MLLVQIGFDEAVARRLACSSQVSRVLGLGVGVVEDVVLGWLARSRRLPCRALLWPRVCIRRRHSLCEDGRFVDVRLDIRHVAPLGDALAPAGRWLVAKAGVGDEDEALVVAGQLYVVEEGLLVDGALRVGGGLPLVVGCVLYAGRRRPCLLAGVCAVVRWSGRRAVSAVSPASPAPHGCWPLTGRVARRRIVGVVVVAARVVEAGVRHGRQSGGQGETACRAHRAQAITDMLNVSAAA